VSGSGSPDGGRPSPPAQRSVAFVFAQLGMFNALCLVAGLGLGWLVDSWIGTMPVFLFVGMVAGIAAGALGTYRQVRQYLNQ
jgi:F0F1-type ATP synthase assembly protein I